MSDVAIRVEGVGKEYHLGAQRQRYHTLGDQIRKMTSIRNLLNRAKRAESRPPFWALKDVSFEVKKGEAVGIIGRNGAGKSTLLKILSRITEPTTGEVDIHGRVGSLLEVGTGFHPELTGRENIYLNGAILGMRRADIIRKFDEIVAFAEVEKFVDTPVKHYSSGMYTRLAFSVAAHLEPEILIVDEVLAVGDAQFQQKCMGKMGEVAGSGRTVLFVSHNMAAVQVLCSRAVLLQSGQVVSNGPTNVVLASYLAYKSKEMGSRRTSALPLGLGLSLERFEVAPQEPSFDEPVSIEFEISSELERNSLTELCLILYSVYDVRIGILDLRSCRAPYSIIFGRRLIIRCNLTSFRLVEGDFKFGLYLTNQSGTVNVTDLYNITVVSSTSNNGIDESFIQYPPQHRGVVEFNFEVSRFESTQ